MSAKPSSSRPYEIPVLRSDGPFFRPTIVGHESVIRDPKNRLYHDYSTDAVEKMELILITLSGSAQAQILNTREQLRRGSILMLSLPCDARIQIRDQSTPWEFAYVHASDPTPFSAFKWLRSQYGNVAHLPAQTRGLSRLVSDSRQLCNDLRLRSNQNIISCSRRTYFWFLTLVDVLRDFRHESSQIRHGKPLEASNVIGGCHTIKEYARQLNYSPSYLSRKLSKSWQKPPGRALRLARMEQAASLLRESDLAVWEVASRVGYFSTSSFIRAFHALYKTTPAMFRHGPIDSRPPDNNPLGTPQIQTPTPTKIQKARKTSTTSASGRASRRQAST